MGRLADLLFVRGKHTCPWYCCFTFDNVFRKLVQNPYAIVGSYVRPGDTVLDMGPGQGYFTLPMARMVGEKGKVIAADIQERMLSVIAGKASQQGLDKIIACHLLKNSNLGMDSEVDFALAFWMVHEVADRRHFLSDIYKALKPQGKFLIVEPKVHVTAKDMDETRCLCESIGFKVVDQPKVFFSRSIFLQKQR